MQLYKKISAPNSSTEKVLTKLKKVLSHGKVKKRKEDMQFAFLCGGNIDENTPSKRRKAILDFAQNNLPNTRIFLAEKIFNFLEKDDKKLNLLDVEDKLTQISDYVLIVLESQSAFCELGAFTIDYDLRHKIIVINDEKYKDTSSFINIGPIRAINSVSSNNVLNYKMDLDGKIYGDGIGETFDDLYKLIHKKPEKTRSKIKRYNPNINFNKESLRFLYDLIYLTNPITPVELQRVIYFLFDKTNENNINLHLALLIELDEIYKFSLNTLRYYNTTSNYFYYDYDFDLYDFMATFKNFYFKNDPKRLVWNS